MTKIFVISGSRHWQPSQFEAVKPRVQAAVAYAQQNDYVLFIGDAPGVDELAAWYAVKANYPCVIHGINGKVRVQHINKLGSLNVGFTSYRDRDEYMVSAATAVWCMWNGKSKGTKHVHYYAKMLGKQTWLETIQQEAV